jgi:hypothetical protein
MNAARASRPSRMERGVSCRAPLPVCGCAARLRGLFALREEYTHSAVAGSDACTPAADESVLPCGRTLPRCLLNALTEMRGTPDAFHSHPRRDCVSRPPRDVVQRASGHFHASYATTLAETGIGRKNDLGGFCAKAVGSWKLLWKSEEKLGGILSHKPVSGPLPCCGHWPTP